MKSVKSVIIIIVCYKVLGCHFTSYSTPVIENHRPHIGNDSVTKLATAGGDSKPSVSLSKFSSVLSTLLGPHLICIILIVRGGGTAYILIEFMK